MHFEILTEDISGKNLLDILVPSIINTTRNTYRTISYKGLGNKIPQHMSKKADPRKRQLLQLLPKLLQGYGKMPTENLCLLIVIDNDKRNTSDFINELHTLLNNCNPKPRAHFIIAIEEMEAWLLGDINAIEKAYPKYDKRIYKTYVQDSLCDTWEKLADILKERKIKNSDYKTIGRHKSLWAMNIAPHMNINTNRSPSFQHFVAILQNLSTR